MKNSYYFPHDYHARHDPKLERLFLTMGYEGLGIYWCLIEMLYEQGGKILLTDIPLYAKEPKLYQHIDNVINNFSLFGNDGQCFWSTSVLKRLQFREEKSQKSSISALKRWGNANAMPTQCEGNAIKERKGKEIKEKHRIDKIRLVYTTLKNHSLANYASNDFARTGKAIVELINRAKDNDALVLEALEWISEQKFEWTLETLNKKWVDFMAYKQSKPQVRKI